MTDDISFEGSEKAYKQPAKSVWDTFNQRPAITHDIYAEERERATGLKPDEDDEDAAITGTEEEKKQKKEKNNLARSFRNLIPPEFRWGAEYEGPDMQVFLKSTKKVLRDEMGVVNEVGLSIFNNSLKGEADSSDVDSGGFPLFFVDENGEIYKSYTQYYFDLTRGSLAKYGRVEPSNEEELKKINFLVSNIETED